MVIFIILILLFENRNNISYFNSTRKIPVDMKLFMQFLVGSAISCFAILIIFADISSLEFFFQSISSINFRTWSVLTSSNLKLKEFWCSSLIIWILGWLLKLEIRVKIFELPEKSSTQSNIPKSFVMLTKYNYWRFQKYLNLSLKFYQFQQVWFCHRYKHPCL